MAMTANYLDDVLDTSYNTRRHYRIITHSDGTVSFEDATVYSQKGTSFGAEDVNGIIKEINEAKAIALPKTYTVELTYKDSKELIGELEVGTEYNNKKILATAVYKDLLYNKKVNIAVNAFVVLGKVYVRALSPDGEFVSGDSLVANVLVF